MGKLMFRTRRQFERAIMDRRRERATLPREYLERAIAVTEEQLEKAQPEALKAKLRAKLAELRQQLEEPK